MRLMIGAVGRMTRGPEADLVDDYIGRTNALGRQRGITGPDIHECDGPRGLSGRQRMDAEAAALVKPVDPADSIFILDERGKALKSTDLAAQLERLADGGATRCWFLIGGADGHGTPVTDLKKAGKATAISFGPATWPHMLVRVMLAEQLYRAVTIMAGHPYHRE